MKHNYTVVLAVPESGKKQYAKTGDKDTTCYTALVTAKDLKKAVVKARKEHARAMKTDGVTVEPDDIPVVVIFKGHPEIAAFSFQTYLYERW